MGYKKLWPGIIHELHGTCYSCIHANVSLHMGTRSQVLACIYAATNLFSCTREPQASCMIHKTNMLVLQDFYKIFTRVSQACTFSTRRQTSITPDMHTPPPLSLLSLIVPLSLAMKDNYYVGVYIFAWRDSWNGEWFAWERHTSMNLS